LKRLSELAQQHPMLSSELKHFRFHTYGMRGLHFLETGRAELALAEFQKALHFMPWSANTYYLLIKSAIIAGLRHLRAHISAGF